MNWREASGRHDSPWSSFYSADMALYKYSSKETTSGGETSQRKTNRRLEIRYSQGVQVKKKKDAQRRNFTRISCWSELTFFIIYPLCVQKNRSASSYFLLLCWTPRGAQKKKKKKSHSLIHYDCLTLKEGSLPSRTLGKFKYRAYKCKQWLMRQEGGGHSRPQRGIIWFTIRVLPFF